MSKRLQFYFVDFLLHVVEKTNFVFKNVAFFKLFAKMPAFSHFLQKCQHFAIFLQKLSNFEMVHRSHVRFGNKLSTKTHTHGMYLSCAVTILTRNTSTPVFKLLNEPLFKLFELFEKTLDILWFFTKNRKMPTFFSKSSKSLKSGLIQEFENGCGGVSCQNCYSTDTYHVCVSLCLIFFQTLRGSCGPFQNLKLFAKKIAKCRHFCKKFEKCNIFKNKIRFLHKMKQKIKKIKL